MRGRWLPIALGVSVLLNVVLALGWLQQIYSEAVLATDTGSSFRRLASERAQLQAMRQHFCPHDAAPTRAALLAWEASARTSETASEPFAKDGLLWIGGGDVGVKLDAHDRLAGICLSQTWQALNDVPLRAYGRAGELCPLEPLC
jgi:hypothetical protein